MRKGMVLGLAAAGIVTALLYPADHLYAVARSDVVVICTITGYGQTDFGRTPRADCGGIVGYVNMTNEMLRNAKVGDVHECKRFRSYLNAMLGHAESTGYCKRQG